ncbi:MAG: hypothetical protein H7333_03485 [Bdellovibrionales bacterium]|nr:hypothetical protein [Oligoflexia bacterium]
MKKIVLAVIALVLVLGIGFQVRKSMKSGSGNGQIGSSNNGTNVSTPQVDSEGKVIANGQNTNAQNSSGSDGENSDAPGSSTASSGSTGSTASVTNTSGTNGTTAGVNPVTGAPLAAGTTPGAVDNTPKENCFAFEYRHKKDAKVRDIEDYLDFTNAFPILHPNYNPETMCVKVNSKPENFSMVKTKRGPEARIGSVVGPESVIRVSYCINKVTCKEDCKAPKKRFMDDMMSDAGDDDTFSDSWGKGDDANKKDLRNKAKELRAVASESQSLNEGAVVRDWETLQKQEWVCKESQKRKEK